MTIRFVRRVAAVASGLALGASLVAMIGGAEPASAETPTISISPTSIADGGRVTIDLEGFYATGYTAALVCPASYAGTAGANPTDALTHCGLLAEAAGSRSLQTTVAVNDFNTAQPGGATFRCSTLPGGCVIAGVNAPDGRMLLEFVSTPITIAPPAQTITAAVSSANNSDSVTVTMTGFPTGQPGTIGECPSDVTAATVSTCGPLASYPNGIPASAQVLVHDQYQGSNGTWSRCDYPDCVLAAWAGDPSPAAFAQTPFSVHRLTPVANPTQFVADGQTVTVSASRATPGPASIMECPSQAWTNGVYTTCTPPQAFTIDASGSFSIPFVFHNPIPGVDGQARQCGATCDLVVVTSNGPAPYNTSITFANPSVVLEGQAPYVDGQAVGAHLLSFPDGPATVAECAAGSVGADFASSDCTDPETTAVIASSSYLSHFVHASFAGRSGTVDCGAVSCALVAFGVGGVVGSTPLSVMGLSLTPNTGLHDGNTMTVAALGLSPNTSYRLAHCVVGTDSVGSRCESPLPAAVTSDANGNISATVTALQRFTTGGFFPSKACFATACSIAVIDTSGAVKLEQPYTLATPTVAASPTTGLADGQTISVSGSDLEPNYAGPTILLPTGGWALAECDKAVGTNPTLLDVFTNCGIPPGAGAVNVPGTTSSSSVQVQATLTKILGGTTDCTASPGACVVGLVRWEQDASVTAAFTPLTFG